MEALDRASGRVHVGSGRGALLGPNGLARFLAGSDVRLLSDRLLPGTTATIDHVAVGRSGVTVILNARERGKGRVKNGRLRVAGRDRTSLVELLRREMEVIRLGLANYPDVPVSGAICRADDRGLPPLRKVRIDGIPVEAPRPLSEQLRRPGPITARRARYVANLLEQRLPRAR